MKPELTIAMAANDFMSWIDAIRYYWPDHTPAQCDYILWNETCYTFSAELTLKQLYELYIKGK